MDTKVFKIPVSWSVYGEVAIEAKTLQQAIEIFKIEEEMLPLPLDNEYIDGSFHIDDEETAYLINEHLINN